MRLGGGRTRNYYGKARECGNTRNYLLNAKQSRMERPRRVRRPPPPTYWEEFVETDQWYVKKLLEDIPPDEMHAACFDENLNDDEQCGEEGDETSDNEGEEESSEDCDYVQLSELDSDIDESSDGDPASHDSEYSTEGGETSEGESGSQTEDGESEGCPVGEEWTGT